MEISLPDSACSPSDYLDMVLIIDDHKEVADVTAAFIQHDGFKTHCEYDGRSAMEWIARHAPPALVILDCEMPEMNGLEVLSALKADPQWAAIPVLFHSASTAANRSMAMQLGADGWYVKGGRAWEGLYKHVKTLLS